jgi:hypothetical protein
MINCFLAIRQLHGVAPEPYRTTDRDPTKTRRHGFTFLRRADFVWVAGLGEIHPGQSSSSTPFSGRDVLWLCLDPIHRFLNFDLTFVLDAAY